MPDVTPYFDIERYKKTPMEQSIPHLVAMCGEKHVTLVCQAMAKVLTGNGTAVFLPRYALIAMMEAQITSQFTFHEKWLHSLKSITLAPMIFHLDQQRIQYREDGGINKQSTREWASSLVLPDGTLALCDVVNGTKEKKAMLLAPAHYYEQAKQEFKGYRMRLSPPSHREARYRESIPDLPDEIHIKTAADTNILLMDNLLTSAAWKKVPEMTGKQTETADASGKQ
jgi:hypothetical protein